MPNISCLLCDVGVTDGELRWWIYILNLNNRSFTRDEIKFQNIFSGISRVWHQDHLNDQHRHRYSLTVTLSRALVDQHKLDTRSLRSAFHSHNLFFHPCLHWIRCLQNRIRCSKYYSVLKLVNCQDFQDLLVLVSFQDFLGHALKTSSFPGKILNKILKK